MAPINTQDPNSGLNSALSGTPAVNPPNVPATPPNVPQNPPQFGATTPQDVAPPKQPNLVQRIGSKVASGIEAVGAGANPQYDVNDRGATIARMPTRSLFKGILSSALAALAGAGAGAAAVQNPQARSSPAASFGAGLNAGFQNAQMKDQAARDKAREDFDQQQKTILQKADLAHLNASTKSIYFGMEKDARKPLYDTNNQTATAFENADIPVDRMSASQANALAKQTPGFFTTHIVLPIGMEPVTGPNGEIVSDKDGNPQTQEMIAVIQAPSDPRTRNIVVPQAVAADTQKYANVSGIRNAGNIKAGDEVSLDNYIRIVTANQKAQKAIASGWQTAQKDPARYLTIVGTGPNATAQLMNPVVDGLFRPWTGPIPSDLQATLDLKKAETERDEAETGRAKASKSGTNPDLKNAKAKVGGAKEALADARQAAKAAAEAKYGSRATAAIAGAVSSDPNVKAAQKSYDDALAAQNKLLGISTAAPAAGPAPVAPKAPTAPGTVRMQLPNGQTGTILAAQLQAFLQQHPGSKQIQ